MGGVGKSTLATRAANLLAESGFHVCAVRVWNRGTMTEHACGTTQAIVRALSDAFVILGRQDLYERFDQPGEAVTDRLRLAVHGLNEVRLALFWDNLEDVMEPGTRTFADPVLSEFYESLLNHLTGKSIALLTSRLLPAGSPDASATFLHLPLVDFEWPEFMLFLRRDSAVNQRIRSRDLPPDLLTRVYHRVGGTPSLLATFRTLLRCLTPAELYEQVENDAQGEAGAQIEHYFEFATLDKIFSALPQATRRMLRRVGLSRLPVPLEVVVPIAALPTAEAEAHVGALLASGLVQRFSDPDGPDLYLPSTLARRWLGRMRSPRRQEVAATHRLLAEFWKSKIEANRLATLRVPPEDAWPPVTATPTGRKHRTWCAGRRAAWHG